ncbi:MAG TPA: malto-oligosyltrehalose synthase, partial [Frankiaceae bacterium]|nr:malto-oligosyltrehalose synthase [Frankiaceae bacterium]
MPDRGGHLPADGRPVPTSTYRLQLSADLTFADAAAVVPYLAELSVSHLYCSPYLAAAPGSTHGYDVVDHSRLDPELGGEPGHARLVAACRAAGLGLVLDLVPNHMAVGAPQSRNPAWWSVLRDGPGSPYARWFDIDWDAPDNPGKVLLPVLGASLAACVDKGEVRLSGDGERVTYFDHEAPVAPGTLVPGDVLATLDRQHYRLCQWRVAGDELDYRRFFDVTTLAGLRVEDPDVFDAMHALVLSQVREGVLDGLRVDHPDGLADPEGYLRRLAAATGGVWTVVEKILEPSEWLPGSWPVQGTTGYETLNRLTRLFVDPLGEEPLTALYGELTGEPTDYAEVAADSKTHVLREVLRPEVERLATLLLGEARRRRLDLTRRGLRDAVVEVLVAFDVYRAYVAPGRKPDLSARSTVVRACGRARARRPRRSAEIDLVEELALTGPPEFVTRFQQTCGPVMAKGIEDTALYRYARFLPLNEVGGSPGSFPREYPKTAVEEFHAAAATAQRDWPVGMTTLSTHDTKRSEDVRARLAVLSEDPRSWSEAAGRLLALGDRHTDRER